jgi:SNF2 family DNA or RNA helicase
MDRFDLAIRQRFAEVKRGPEDMHSYQTDIAVPFLRDNPFSGGFVDLGLGKTVSSLTVISEILSEFTSDDPVLVIGPLRVICDTWPTEIATWRHTAWMNYVVIRDEGKSRKEDLARSKASIHLINWEMVEWLVYFHRESWPYRIVICDESDRAKDHSSKRFKALAKVRRTPGLIERLHILTGTPATESYIGLFAQIYLLDLGKRLGKDITEYRERYFSYNKYSMKYTLRPGAEEDILSKIADCTLVMKKQDYLPMAEPTIIQHKVRLSQAQQDMLKKLERDFIITLPDGTELEARTAAILSSMLLQMASGCVYETLLLEDWETDDLKKVKKVHQLHDHKIEALKELAEEAANEGKPLLVAYHFQSSLAKLIKAFPKAVVMDKAGKCVKAWNASKIPMLLVHPQSASDGLNLQHGGSTLIFYDLIYSLRNYLQIIGRLDRQGQVNPVLVILLVAAGSRDEMVAECLAQKKDAQDKFFAILRRLIRELKAKRKAEQALADDL